MSEPEPTFFPMFLDGVGEPAPESSAEPLPLLAVYGDSFTSGYAGFGVGDRNWTTLVARRLNLSVANNAVGGTGWVQCPGAMTYPGQVAATPVPDAAVVAFFGSFNDRVTQSSSAVGVAVTVALRLARFSSPDAALVVAGPQWPGPNPPALMLAHRDAVKAAALAAGAVWADPLAENWFDGTSGLITPMDSIHPTNAGHERIADMIAPHVAAALGR